MVRGSAFTQRPSRASTAAKSSDQESFAPSTTFPSSKKRTIGSAAVACETRRQNAASIRSAIMHYSMPRQSLAIAPAMTAPERPDGGLSGFDGRESNTPGTISVLGLEAAPVADADANGEGASF